MSDVNWNYAGKTVLVTGASQGIGLAIAQAFRDAGARVHISGTRRESGDYETDLSGFSYHAANLREPGARLALAAAVPAIDVLINNAGTGSDREYEIDEFRNILEINLVAAMELSTLYRDCLAKRRGAIINVGSVASFLALKETPAYTASKGGMIAMTRALADKWAPLGIRVNMIAPGFIRTRATEGLRSDPTHEKRLLATVPMRRWGEPSEVAGSVLFLASDQASYITGSSLVIDGGMMVR